MMKKTVLLLFIFISTLQMISSYSFSANALTLKYHVTGLCFPGASSCVAEDINDTGQIVGFAALAHKEKQFIAFLYDGEKFRDLGNLGYNITYAVSINKRGDVVGHGNADFHAAESDSSALIQCRHAFVYSNGKIKNIGTLGGCESYALDINDNGIIVGKSQIEDYYTEEFPSTHILVYADARSRIWGVLGVNTLKP